MPSLISGSCFIQTAIRRLCFGLMLVGLNFATHGAQAEVGYFVPKFDPLTVQFIHSDIDLPTYRFSERLVLVRSANTVPIELGFSSTPRLPSIGEPKREDAFSPLMRFELKEERLKITLRRRSVSMVWHKEFH